MEYEKLIAERYSVRKFENRPLSQNDIDKMLNAAIIAPTGCNYQPQRILVINSENALAKLKLCTKCHFDAPAAMLVCYNKNETWTRPYDGAKSAPVDAAIVTTHIMLEAHNIGVGTCWVMHFDPAALKREFNINEEFEPLALLVMGYPHKDAKPFEMHYKSKSVEEIVSYC